jgi:hypothetical protein
VGFGLYAAANLLDLDPLLGMCAEDLEKLSRQLERRLVAFGLQALIASVLQSASG